MHAFTSLFFLLALFGSLLVLSRAVRKDLAIVAAALGHRTVTRARRSGPKHRILSAFGRARLA